MKNKIITAKDIRAINYKHADLRITIFEWLYKSMFHFLERYEVSFELYDKP